jgi:hypothetical protein
MMPVSKVSWTQVGEITEPGRFIFKFGWLTVAAEELAIWSQFPGATGSTQTDDDGEEYRLGVFDISD